MYTREPDFLHICLCRPITLDRMLQCGIPRLFRWFGLPEVSGEFDSMFVKGDGMTEGLDNLVGGDEFVGMSSHAYGVDSVPMYGISEREAHEGGGES
jgi:hypothetical protein